MYVTLAKIDESIKLDFGPKPAAFQPPASFGLDGSGREKEHATAETQLKCAIYVAADFVFASENEHFR